MRGRYPDGVGCPPEPGTATGAIKRVADQLGIHPEALQTWVRQAEIDGVLRPGTTTDDTSRITELSGRSASSAKRTRSCARPQRSSPRRSRLRTSTYRAGVLFVLPGMLALLGLSAVYVAYDDTPLPPGSRQQLSASSARETTKMRILASEDGVNGTPSVRSGDHSCGSISTADESSGQGRQRGGKLTAGL